MPKKKTTGGPVELKTMPSRIRYARDRAGLSLRALAEKSDCFPGQLSRLENGQRIEGVEAATAIRIAKALGVPVGWLLADEGQLPAAPVLREPSDRRTKAYRAKASKSEGE